MELKIMNCVRNAKGQALMQVHVPATEFSKMLEVAFAEALPTLELPGLNPKTATRAQAEAILGAQYFYPAAAQRCCQEALPEAAAQAGLDTVGYPEFTSCSTDPTGLSFTAVLDLYPQVTLGEYKNMRPQLEKPTITEEEVQQTLEMFAARAAEEQPLEKAAELGDSVRLDLEGFTDSKPFPGGKAEDYPLELGSHTFIPGLEEGIAGMSAGEERDVPVTFPDNYTPELAGKDAVFHVKLLKVYQKVEPQLDDAFARKYFECSMEELRESLRTHLLADKQAQYLSALEDAALNMAADNMQVTLPESMIRQEADFQSGQMENRLASKGITLEQYCQSVGLSEEEYQETARKSAVMKLRQDVLMRAVQQAEGLEIDAAFRRKAIRDIAVRYDTTEESVEKSMSNPLMQRELLRMRVLEVILAKKGQE